MDNNEEKRQAVNKRVKLCLAKIALWKKANPLVPRLLLMDLSIKWGIISAFRDYRTDEGRLEEFEASVQAIEDYLKSTRPAPQQLLLFPDN